MKRILAFFVFSIIFIPAVQAQAFPKQVILIGVDGMQLNHFNQMLAAGNLTNFGSMISGGGWNGSLTITGHSSTETAPGNAELHSGLTQSLNGVDDNSCGVRVIAGKTIFERLHSFNPGILLGSVYGKGTCYIPDAVLGNAKPIIGWWHNRTTYPQTTWVSSNCADSRNVSTKALEFIASHWNESFYLVVYFGAPDCSGHAYGENSARYNTALINVDQGLGIILNGLASYGISGNVQIILTEDHGWNEGSYDHAIANSDTKVIPLVSNNASMVATVPGTMRKQCDVAPTVLDYFGMGPSDYQDITNLGCGSMIATPPPPTCQEMAGPDWDCCGTLETCSGMSYTGTSDCAGTCCSAACIADTTPPSIIFVPPTPEHMTNVTANYIQVNASVSEAPDTCILSWYLGDWTNYTMTKSGTNCYRNMTGLENWTYWFMVYANDSSGNMGVSGTRADSVTYSPPPIVPFSITFVPPTPENGTTLNQGYITVNVSLPEAASTCTLNWYSGSSWRNYSMTRSGTHCYRNMTGLSNRTYQFRVYAAKSGGKLNLSETRQSTIMYSPPDRTAPTISFVSPTPSNNANVTRNYIDVRVSLSELPSSCMLNWYNGVWTNYTMAMQDRYCSLNMTNLVNYTYQFRVYATDLAGNTRLSSTRRNTVRY